MDYYEMFKKGMLGMLVTVVLLLLLLAFVDENAVIKYFYEVDKHSFFPFIIAFILQFSVRAIRWMCLLPDSSMTNSFLKRFRISFDSLLLGSFGNYVLPFRAGEFIRPILPLKENICSYTSGLLSVAIERFMDLVVILISFTLLFLMHDSLDKWMYDGAMLFLLIVIMLLVGSMTLLYFRRQAPVLRVIKRLMPQWLFYKVRAMICKVERELGSLKSGKQLALVFIISCIIWLVNFFQFQILLYYMGFEFSFEFAATIGVIVALAVAAPSAPGYIGVIQVACVAAFSLYGIEAEKAIAYSIVFQLYQYIFVLGYGSLVVIRYNMSIGSLLSMRGCPGKVSSSIS